jgi:hypothetical protein
LFDCGIRHHRNGGIRHHHAQIGYVGAVGVCCWMTVRGMMGLVPDRDEPWAVLGQSSLSVPDPGRWIATAAKNTESGGRRRSAGLYWQVSPIPVGGTEEAAQAWFQLMALLSDSREPNGLTLKQVASREGVDKREAWYLGDMLNRLAEAGDLRRTGNPPRFSPQPYHKSLPRYLAWLRREGKGLQRPEWDAFELAILEYEDDPRQAQWSRLKACLVALTDVLPGWPEQVRAEVRAGVERWAGPAANVRPPSHVAIDDEWARLRLEVERLREENERLKNQVAEQGAKTLAERTRLKQRVEDLERANAAMTREMAELREQLDGLEEDLGAVERSVDRPELRDFLDGKGRGVLPVYVLDDEVERLRKLVLGTRATRDRQLVLAERLGDIYRTPERFQRLTSTAFQQAVHPYDTLRRLAVYKYRIGYGLLKKVPHIIDIGPRENFYARFLDKLHTMRL